MSHFIYADVLDEIVLQALSECVTNNTFTVSQKPRRERPEQDWYKLIASEKRRLERAKMAYLDGVMELDDYKETKKEIENTISILEERQKEPEPIKTEDLKPRTMSVLQVLESPDVSGELKNKAIRSIVEKVSYIKEQRAVEIYFVGSV